MPRQITVTRRGRWLTLPPEVAYVILECLQHTGGDWIGVLSPEFGLASGLAVVPGMTTNIVCGIMDMLPSQLRETADRLRAHVKEPASIPPFDPNHGET